MTEKSNEYWQTRASEHAQSIAEYFKTLEDSEVASLFKIMNKLEKLSLTMYEDAKNVNK